MTFRLPSPNWPIKDLKQGGYYFYENIVTDINGSKVVVEGYGEMLMFSSYSYLDLLRHPDIERAAHEAIARFGVGAMGARLLAGTTTLHIILEKRIAEFKGTEAAITFVSGFLTNATVIEALVGRGDYVISDKLNHASIVDGCKHSGANFLSYNHNDMNQLDEFLRKLPADRNKLVVADAVFSMEGDILDLPSAVDICKKHGALLMVDEAHSLGVIGKTGHGIEEHYNMPNNSIDIKMGTLSKSIGTVGGYIAGSFDLIELLRHRARGYIYSIALPAVVAGAADKAFEIIDQENWRVAKLQSNADFMKQELHRYKLSTLQSQTAVIPIMCGDNITAMDMAKKCQHNGLYIQAVVAPVVPDGQARLRCIVTAAHSKDELSHAASVIAIAARDLGIVP